MDNVKAEGGAGKEEGRRMKAEVGRRKEEGGAGKASDFRLQAQGSRKGGKPAWCILFLKPACRQAGLRSEV
jgi:hypothetical protein